MSERKEGWYWVKLEDSDGWIPWEWVGQSSLLKARWYNSEEPVEIGPRILTPDEMEGWQVVPKDGTTERMDDAARGFLLMLSMRSDISYERLRQELAMRGESDLIGVLPEYAQFGEAHIPKAAQADILFRLMCSAAPKPEDV